MYLTYALINTSTLNLWQNINSSFAVEKAKYAVIIQKKSENSFTSCESHLLTSLTDHFHFA